MGSIGEDKKVVAFEVTFHADSRNPFPAGTGFQAMLRAGENRDRAARGIRVYVIENTREATSRQPTSVTFCGVYKEVSPPAAVGDVVGGPVHDGNTGAGSSIQL